MKDRVQAGAVLVDGNAVGELKSCVMKERRELAEDGLIAISVTLDKNGGLAAPLAIESRGVFLPEDPDNIVKEIRTATERVLRELAGKALDVEDVSKLIKNRVRDIIRHRNSSYAVVMPLVSIVGKNLDNSGNWIEKDFF